MAPPRRSAPARNAASVVVVRDGPGGIEVLLMRRAERGDRFSGAWVFPGGVLEAGDRSLHGLCTGLDDAAASGRLGLAEGGLDYWVAAMRECFEEAGLLFGVDGQGRAIACPPDVEPRWAELRRQLHRGDCNLADVCRALGVRLAAGDLAYIGHWITPPGVVKRFDTRFFVAAQPLGQVPGHDAVELLEHAWLRPVDALAPPQALRMVAVTQTMLEEVSRHQDVASLMAWAHSQPAVETVMRRRARGLDGESVSIMPAHPAYHEMALLDPEGEGHLPETLGAGAVTRLSARVQRVTAPNGCNSYLLDAGGGACVVIDAGPDDASHRAALRAAAGQGRIDTVLSTGANDSPDLAAEQLARETGARVVQGEPADRLELAGTQLVALAAPDGGIDWLLEDERLLFTSEHQGLGEGFDEKVAWIAPRRGFLMRAREA